MFGAKAETETVVIGAVAGPGDSNFALRLGYRRPASASTSGQVILAFRDGADSDSALKAIAAAGFLGRGPNPWQNVTGAAYRGVYDLADPDSSVFVISTGQSGHPLSRHYDDMAELWRRGEYVGMSLDPGLARAGASGITHLRPAPE